MECDLKMNKNDILENLIKKTEGKKTVIVGGHYLLIYNSILDKLVPAILEENNDITTKDISKILVGNFPVQSYEFAVQFVVNKIQKNETAKISLLVNDHLFQSKSLQFLNQKKISNWGGYKEDYYKNANIPDIYYDILKQHDLNPDNIFLNNTLKKSIYYHPNLFSETSLRKKFTKSLKKSLILLDSFYTKQISNFSSELFFVGDNKASICLTEDGSCGCSGEIMQFVKEINTYKYESLVILVPQECYSSVCIGIQAISKFLNSTQNSDAKHITDYIVVTGFGDYDFVYKSQNRLEFRHFN